MIPRPTIALEPDLGAGEVEELFNHLAQSGELHAPPRRYRALNLVLRDAKGTLQGGLLGSLVWNWLQIDLLWVAEAWRGQGFARELIATAEAHAKGEGCRYARLDSFDFGALPLYQRLGYEVYGTLADFPEGHTYYHLRKTLAG
jgi:GNAT superfamily N-acetyltransferase